MSVIPTLDRLKQKDCFKTETCLDYTVSFKALYAMEGDPCQRKPKNSDLRIGSTQVVKTRS